MALPTVLITNGANGIGYALVEEYAARKWSVIATVRDTSDDTTKLRCLPTVRVVEMDLSDQNSITTAAVHLSGEKIDVVINCASELVRGGLEDLADTDFLSQLQVNTMSPFLVTRAFLPNLRLAVERHGGAKVVNVGSRMGCIAENVSGGLYGYRASKAGLHMVSKSLAIDLKHENIAVLLIDPGHAEMETTTESVEDDQRAIAEKMVRLVDAASVDEAGKFLDADGGELPW